MFSMIGCIASIWELTQCNSVLCSTYSSSVKCQKTLCQTSRLCGNICKAGTKNMAPQTDILHLERWPCSTTAEPKSHPNSKARQSRWSTWVAAFRSLETAHGWWQWHPQESEANAQIECGLGNFGPKDAKLFKDFAFAMCQLHRELAEAFLQDTPRLFPDIFKIHPLLHTAMDCDKVSPSMTWCYKGPRLQPPGVCQKMVHKIRLALHLQLQNQKWKEAATNLPWHVASFVGHVPEHDCVSRNSACSNRRQCHFWSSGIALWLA